MTYELHPLCTFFPRLEGSDFDSLRDDIKEKGLNQPIVIYEGMILDGGNRYKACIEAGVTPEFKEFDGENIADFVMSVNFHRRHLSAGQRAAIVSGIQDWSQSHPSHRTEKEGCKISPFSTVADRASISGASHRTQQKADKVAKVDLNLAKQVGQGKVSLAKAIKSITPQKEQENHEEFDEKSIREEMADEFDPVAEIEKAHKEIDQLTSIIESDDKLAAAMAEINRLNALIEVIESQKRAFQSSENAAKQAAKMWKNKFEKLEKQMKASGLVEF